MKILEDSITYLARGGHITLQVPEFGINFGPEPVELKEADLPDDWFVSLNGNDLPSPQGFLFLSRKGWEANKTALWKAFAVSRGDPQADRNSEIVTREQYEAAIEAVLKAREEAINKKIKSLKKAIAKLEAFVP